MKRLLVILVAALVLPSSAAASEFGGVRWSESVDKYAYAGLPGNFWAEVWYYGHAPVGAYHAYMFKMRTEWSTIYRNGRWRFTKKPTVSVMMLDEKPTVRYDGLQGESFDRRYSCRVDGKFYRNGCWHFYRKGQVTHTLPPGFGVSSLVGRPAVSIRIAPNGRIVVWWWKSARIPL